MILLIEYTSLRRKYTKCRTESHYKQTLEMALRITESFDSIDDVRVIAKEDKDLGIVLEDVYLHREKNENILKTIEKAYKSKKEYKIQAELTMKLFLFETLPTALWKRELDLPLDGLEQSLLMEIIPETRCHELWDDITSMVTLHLLRNMNKCCRQCGKKKAPIRCRKCRGVYFCSVKCQRKTMEQRIYGHYKLECVFIQQQKK